jgi:hypothetical protein
MYLIRLVGTELGPVENGIYVSKVVSTRGISAINITSRGRYTTIQPKEVDRKPSNTARVAAPAEKTNSMRKEKAEKLLSLSSDINGHIDAMKMSEPQGPVLPLPSGVDAQKPLDVFNLFFPDGTWDTIARNTNAYAEIKRVSLPHQSRRWSPTGAPLPAPFKAYLLEGFPYLS